MRKLHVSIIIPAYKAEKNIQKLLKSLLVQRNSQFDLKEILVYYDCGGDKTLEEIKKVKSRKILVIKGEKRQGMAHGFKILLEKSKGNVIILLNDDILIKDRNCISKLIEKFNQTKAPGLISGNPQPIPHDSFFNKAQISAFRSYENARNQINDGNNKLSCDGKVLVLSRQFYKKIKFPKSNADMGNVDAYLYRYNRKLGMGFAHAKDAIVYYELPTNPDEYVRWTARNNSNAKLMEKQFGRLVDPGEDMRNKILLKSLIKESLKNPLGALYLFFLGRYAKIKSREISKNFNPVWENIDSTKRQIATIK